MNMVLRQDLWNFSFFGWGDVSRTHSELCHFVLGSRTKHQVSSPTIIFVKKKFLSASAIAIMSWQDMTQSSLCSGVKECEQNVHITFSFPNPLSESEELQSWGCSKNLLSFLNQFDGHSDQISNSSNIYLSSSWFWMATSLIFYQLPSVSKSRIPPKNIWSVQSLIPTSLLYQY